MPLAPSVPCPPISDEEGFVRWTLRYGSEFEAIRQTFFKERPDSFVEVGVKHVLDELRTYPEPEALKDRYTRVAETYEKLVPHLLKAGGVLALPMEHRFQCIEMYIRLIFMLRYVLHKTKEFPKPPYDAITRFPL